MVMEYKIEPIKLAHYEMGFLETLASLKQVELTQEEFDNILGMRYENDVKTYVIVTDGKVVSTASLFIEPKFYGFVAHIEDVATRENYKHQGFATELVQYCVKEAKEAGCYKAILDCSDKNVEWYRSMNFYRQENQMRRDL